MRSLRLLSAVSILSLALSQMASGEAKKQAAMNTKKSADMFAIFDTSMGSFKIRLLPDDAPQAVANFVGLAEGTKEFTDPRTGQKIKKRYYDGLIFHRVIAGFMIQGGDPLGTGTGGPGYEFEDEVNSGRIFDKPGILAMANHGPNTNGSQFFITVAPTPHLTGGYTIFGEVVEGYEVVEKISKVPTDGNPPRGNSRPLTPVTISKVRIERKK